MITTIDDYINGKPTSGILGKYRFMDGDIYMEVTGRHAKLIDYMVEAHMNEVKEQSGMESFYAIIDIRNILRAYPEFSAIIRSEMFQKTIKACAFVAETDFSRMLVEQWLKAGPISDRYCIADSSSLAIDWIHRRRTEDEGPTYSLAS